MNCTHPVLYERKDGLYCVVCRSVVAPGGEVDKNHTPEEKPAEGPKKAVKRTRKKATDD
jgi:hypothetical protein